MLNLIAAVAKNNCIGKNNKLPWHIPADLVYFKKITKDKIVLMGRKTFESIIGYLGRPLPNRLNLVITTNPNYQVPAGVEVFNNIQSALDAHAQEEIFVIGGAGIYRQTIDMANQLYITLVNKEVKGDAFFPEINPKIWQESTRQDHDGYSFVKYVKK